MLILNLVLILFTTLATLATGTSTKPTSSSTAVPSTTDKSTITVITARSTTSNIKARSTTSNATTSITTATGRRKRDVDYDGNWYIFLILSVLYWFFELSKH